MAKIKKVGHVVLGVCDPARSVKFYTEVLGMELVKVLAEMQMAFFSFGERDHDIAVIKVPDEQPVGSSGLAHTALEIEGEQEQLRELYDRLKHSDARVEFTADHVLTKSVYFFDPDGNRLEIFSQELPSAGARQYLHEARTAADVMRPLDLETATSVGRASSCEPV
jgi:catechol 2,3-dioxygenase